MALGVLANIGLIMRFLERKPLLATWVAIVALTAHDIINITIVVTFGVVHRIDDGFVGLFSAQLSSWHFPNEGRADIVSLTDLRRRLLDDGRFYRSFRRL